MKIAIYKEFGRGCIGGSEFMMAVLADGLSAEHEVEIVHHQPEMTKERLAAMFGITLESVGIRYVAPLPRPNLATVNPWHKYRAARERYADLSRDADVFVCLTHGEEPPPFCHANVGVLVVLFPLSERPALWPNRHLRNGWRSTLKEKIGRRYLEWEWRRRLSSYRIRTSISEFVRCWTNRLWGIDTEIFHPPVETKSFAGHKTNTILSVGRFCSLKNQRILVDVFRNTPELVRDEWKLVCAGGVGTALEEQRYYDDLTKHANGYSISLMPNLSRAKLQNQFGYASIFWHAAGYGADEEADPGQSEHFGIVTVEAMAAGCVPVVIRKGGQTELIEHGVNGFLWSSPDELRHYTLLLANDEALRTRMAESAKSRSHEFGKDVCVNRFRSLIESHVAPAPSL